jgi:hypothetical protein
MRGLVSTLGAVIYGLVAYLVFHLLAESVFSDHLVAGVTAAVVWVREQLECPFCVEQRGLPSWLLVGLLFAVATVVASTRFTSRVVAARRAYSLLEALLMSFLSFSVVSAQTEEVGLRSENRLFEKAEKRAYVAHALEQHLQREPPTGVERTSLASLEAQLDRSGESELTMLNELVAEIENSGLGDQGAAAGPPMVDMPSGVGRSPLLRVHKSRTLLERQANASAHAIQELLSHGVEAGAGTLHTYFADLLVSSIADAITDWNEESVRKVCARVLRVMNGRQISLIAVTPAELIERARDRVATAREKQPDWWQHLKDQVKNREGTHTGEVADGKPLEHAPAHPKPTPAFR